MNSPVTTTGLLFSTYTAARFAASGWTCQHNVCRGSAVSVFYAAAAAPVPYACLQRNALVLTLYTHGRSGTPTVRVKPALLLRGLPFSAFPGRVDWLRPHRRLRTRVTR